MQESSQAPGGANSLSADRGISPGECLVFLMTRDHNLLVSIVLHIFSPRHIRFLKKCLKQQGELAFSLTGISKVTRGGRRVQICHQVSVEKNCNSLLILAGYKIYVNLIGRGQARRKKLAKERTGLKTLFPERIRNHEGFNSARATENGHRRCACACCRERRGGFEGGVLWHLRDGFADV